MVADWKEPNHEGVIYYLRDGRVRGVLLWNVWGQQIADTLETMLEPHGVAVYLEAHHMCMQMRGVHESSPLTRTTFWRGAYDDNPALRSEFFTACGLQR